MTRLKGTRIHHFVFSQVASSNIGKRIPERIAHKKRVLYNWNKVSLNSLSGISLHWGRNQISWIVPLLDLLNFDFLQLLLRISCPACLKAIYHRP